MADSFGFLSSAPEGLKKPETPPPSYQDEAEGFLAAYMGKGWWTQLIAALLAGIESIILMIATVFAKSLNALMASFGPLMLATQNHNQPEFNIFVTTLLSDLLGLELDPRAVNIAQGDRGPLAGVEAVGGMLLDQLTEEFTVSTEQGGGTLFPSGGEGSAGHGVLPGTSAAQGMDAAKRFIGFALEFAVRAGNVSVMTEMASLGFLKNFRVYGEEMAGNLGLGRMMRIALRPLFTVLVADPMTVQLNRKWRPKLLSEGQASKALRRGVIDRATFNSILAAHGYPDGAMQLIVDESEALLSVEQIVTLLGHGDITLAAALEKLRWHGYDNETAALLLKYKDRADQDSRDSTFASEALSLAQQRFMDPATFSAVLDKTSLTEADKSGYRKRLGLYLDTRNKRLTLAQMESAFLDGIIDLTQWRDWTRQEGYGPQDRQTLDVMLRAKMADLDAKNAAKALAAKAAAERKKATAEAAAKKALLQQAGGTARPLSAAEWESGYVQGVVTEADYTAFLVDQGYNDKGVQIILGNAREKKQAWQINHRMATELLAGAPARQLTLGQVEDMYIGGLQDDAFLDQYLRDSGYNDEDRTALETFLRVKRDAEAAKVKATAPVGLPGIAAPLTVDQAVAAYVLGELTDARLRDELKAAGLAGAELDLVMAQAIAQKLAHPEVEVAAKAAAAKAKTPELSLAEAFKAYVTDVWTREELQTWLTARGYSARDVQVLLIEADQQRAAAEAKAAAAAGAPAEPGTKRLTLSQAEEGFVVGDLTSSDFAAFLSSEGYSSADAALLLDLALRKRAAAQAKAAAPGAPPGGAAPGPRSLETLQALYLAKLISLAEYQAELRAQHFGTAEIATLVQALLIMQFHEQGPGAVGPSGGLLG